jgi:hypothetical protein
MKSAGTHFAFIMRVSLVSALIACFLLALVPGAAIVSAFGLRGMNCCSSVGHCRISLPKKRRLPKSEPMCGLKSPSAEDEVVVVNEESQSDSQPANTTAIKITDTCGRDCAGCATGLKQRSRDQWLARAQTLSALSGTTRWSVILHPQLRSISEINSFDPRGPPRT